MKKTGLILVVIVLFTVIVFYFMSVLDPVDHNIIKKDDLVTKSQKPKEDKDSRILNVEDRYNSEKKNREEETDEKLPDEYYRVKEGFEADIVSIDFYGQLVDQEGQSVEDAKVEYSALGGYFGYKGGSGVAYTGSNGSFHIKGLEGTSLDIHSITKKGYQIPLVDQESHFYPHKKAGQLKTIFECKKTSPCIIRAWKYSESFDDAELRRDIFMAKIKTDNTFYTVDFFGNLKTKVRKKYDEDKMNLRMSYTTGNREWEMGIESKGIGLIRAESLFTNEAPENGYREKIILTNSKSIKKEGIFKNNIFLYLKDKKIYGRISLIIRKIPNSDEVIIEGRYALNMKGNRMMDSN